MSIMKYAEITKKTPQDLAKLEEKLRIELMKHMAQAATGAPGKESGKIRQIKRDIARVKMALGMLDAGQKPTQSAKAEPQKKTTPAQAQKAPEVRRQR